MMLGVGKGVRQALRCRARAGGLRAPPPPPQALSRRALSSSKAGKAAAEKPAEAAAAASQTYTTGMQWAHWAVGGGILACFGTVYATDAVTAPEAKAALMSYHSQIGLLVLAGVGARIGLRLTSKMPAAIPVPQWQALAGKATHGLMYPLMAAIPLTGVAMGYWGGGGLPFLGLRIPGKDGATEADMATAKDASGWHKDFGSVLEVLVPLHIAAAGVHLATGHNPFARMATPGMTAGIGAAVQAWRTRPAAVAGGAALAAASGLWLGATLWKYAVAGGGGGVPTVAAVAPGDKARVITVEELEKHNSEGDLWIAIEGKVYDMTAYHKMHPGFGGPGIIIKNAGADATGGFRKAKHSPKANGVKDGLFIGNLEFNVKTELAKMMNLDDIKAKAEEMLTPGALAYYNAGAEDGTSMAEALSCWDRDWRLRPRNFIDVSNVDVGTTVLGHRLEVPIMAAPTALLKMGHEDGEAAVARGCAAASVGNCLSTTASLSIEDVAAASPECYRWFQLYVYKDHDRTRDLVQRAEREGYSAIVLTVDLPVLGNRTSLKRIGFSVPKEFKMANVAKTVETDKDKGASGVGGAVDVKQAGDRAAYVAKLYDQSLTLELLTWLGTLTTLPIVVKGILRGDSAALAAQHPNVRGIVVSNHGGRQLDNCIAPLTALPEIVRVVDEVNITRQEQGLEPVEVYVDGGIKRGRDIFKALALGAKAVMLGRPMIYGMAVGGEHGVERTVDLLRDELKTCMQLAGAQTTEQLDRSFVVRTSTDTSASDWAPDGKVWGAPKPSAPEASAPEASAPEAAPTEVGDAATQAPEAAAAAVASQ